MQVVYAKQEFPESWSFAIFLAGPTPRDPEAPSWRPEALAWLERLQAISVKVLSQICIILL